MSDTINDLLKRDNAAFATLINNLPGMVYRCQNDHDWTMEFVSEGSLNLTGYRQEELIDNRKIGYRALIHPEDQESVWNEIQAALNESRSFKSAYRIEVAVGEKWVC